MKLPRLFGSAEMVRPAVSVLPSPQSAAVIENWLAVVAVTLSWNVAPERVAAVTPSTPPVVVAWLVAVNWGVKLRVLGFSSLVSEHPGPRSPKLMQDGLPTSTPPQAAWR